MCKLLPIALSTYYAAKSRPPSARAQRDQVLTEEIRRVYASNYSVYGAPKVWRQLKRERVSVARCTVERLILKRGPWRHLDDVEYATLEWVDWVQPRRLFETIGNIPPAEKEQLFYSEPVLAEGAGLKQMSLH